jgi:DNA-binding response OmpR family regulator
VKNPDAAAVPVGKDDVEAAVSIRMDRVRFVVQVNDLLVETTRLEFDLLDYLVQNADRVVSSQELFEFVIRSTPISGSGLIRVHVAHLRRKLGGASRALRTVRGRGLIWDKGAVSSAVTTR